MRFWAGGREQPHGDPPTQPHGDPPTSQAHHLLTAATLLWFSDNCPQKIIGIGSNTKSYSIMSEQALHHYNH